MQNLHFTSHHNLFKKQLQAVTQHNTTLKQTSDIYIIFGINTPKKPIKNPEITIYNAQRPLITRSMPVNSRYFKSCSIYSFSYHPIGIKHDVNLLYFFRPYPNCNQLTDVISETNSS